MNDFFYFCAGFDVNAVVVVVVVAVVVENRKETKKEVFLRFRRTTKPLKKFLLSYNF